MMYGTAFLFILCSLPACKKKKILNIGNKKQSQVNAKVHYYISPILKNHHANCSVLSNSATPMDYTVHEIFQARLLRGSLPFPSLGKGESSQPK